MHLCLFTAINAEDGEKFKMDVPNYHINIVGHWGTCTERTLDSAAPLSTQLLVSLPFYYFSPNYDLGRQSLFKESRVCA
jgi:hypothetical protein